MSSFFISGLANFGLGVHSVLNQQNKPTTGSAEEMSAAWPDWQCAINMAQNALVSISVGGATKGNGVFVEKDLVLIPKHLLISENEEAVCDQNLETLVESIGIDISNDQCCFQLKAQWIEEEGDTKDYCLLRLFDHSLPCYIPAHKFDAHQTQCLFAEMAQDGSLTVSIVSPCESYQDQMCSPYEHWTRPGSSGGIYLDQSGQLIGIHIGQSSGICRNETGNERSYLPIEEVIFNSQFYCTLDKSFNPLTPPACISPAYENGCINEQAEVKKKGLIVPNFPDYFLDYSEVHVTHSQRQINISLCSKVKNLKTRRTENRQLSNVTYDLMLIEYSKHRAEKENPNIHSKHGHSSYRKENAAEFYEHIAKTFVQRYYQDRQTPYQFDFTFKKCPFRARLSQR